VYKEENKQLGNKAKFKYLGTTIKNQIAFMKAVKSLRMLLTFQSEYVFLPTCYLEQ
jgi:hypothetical protein